MRMTRVVAMAVAAGFLAASPGWAAGQVKAANAARQADAHGDSRGNDRGGPPRGPMKWWQDEKFKSELRLTPDQSARIDAIFEATFPKLRASYQELNKREQQLSSMISANDATEAQVLKQADQIEAIRSELSKTRVLMLFRMRRILSPEQRDRLQALQKEQEQERQRGGPPRD